MLCQVDVSRMEPPEAQGREELVRVIGGGPMSSGPGAVRTPATQFSACGRYFLASVMIGGAGVDGIGDSAGICSSDLGCFLG
jgi:hypothetical protein